MKRPSLGKYTWQYHHVSMENLLLKKSEISKISKKKLRLEYYVSSYPPEFRAIMILVSNSKSNCWRRMGRKTQEKRNRPPKVTLLSGELPDSICPERISGLVWSITVVLWMILCSKENKQGRLKKFPLNFNLVSQTTSLSRFLWIL